MEREKKPAGIAPGRYKGVAFDLDHTLYDRKATYGNMLDAFCKEFGEFITPVLAGDDKALLDALISADHLGSYRGGRRGVLEAMNETGVFVKDPGLERLSRFTTAHIPPAMVIYPDVAETIEWLRRSGYKTGIITNGALDFQNSKIKAIHADEIFDHILVSIESGEKKPAPGPFHAMARMMGIEPGEMLYVGDNPRNDVEGARNAGCTPIWIRTVNIWMDEYAPPEYAIDAIGDLRILLQA